MRSIVAAVLIALLLPTAVPAHGDSGARVGEAIYRHGILGSGAPVAASRDAGMPLHGAQVACVNCHRRSGLGSREARTLIPPITGKYLFHPHVAAAEQAPLPYVEGMRGDREPYSDETLARAIRDGLDAQGRPLSYLMPRYAIGDDDMAALISHLKGLDRRRVPGVTETTLHFATIITPDADPAKRRGMLDVLQRFFEDRNATQRRTAPIFLPSDRNAFSKTMFKVPRHWELHVWELSGPASTWQEQLERQFAAQPVFAVVSGLAGKNWAPVHAFCERSALPCLFPNVEAPPTQADRDFYSVYFSRGVLLEAELIARAVLEGEGGPRPKRVHQVYRVGDSGEAGAMALSELLRKQGVAVSQHALSRGMSATSVAEALRRTAGEEAFVLWLRAPDLATLASGPAGGATIYLSGLLGGLEHAPLPSQWRDRTHIAYPVDLPERRRVRVDYALGWFTIRHIPIVAEQIQADTYLACGLLSETLQHMIDNFVPEYLVERIEDTVEHRVVTGYYPRLTLGTGQRYASKGGYLVHFSEPRGTHLVADHEWVVP